MILKHKLILSFTQNIFLYEKYVASICNCVEWPTYFTYFIVNMYTMS